MLLTVLVVVRVPVVAEVEELLGLLMMGHVELLQTEELLVADHPFALHILHF